jgi:hypothetical protein
MFDSTDVISDPTGFPMVWCEPLRVFVHWLPVTKIQFEHFLGAAPDAYFDAAWYETALDLNPRVSPRAVSAANYWQALMTAVTPAEAQRFASWSGDGFRLPSADEWTIVYRALRMRPAVDLASSPLLTDREPRTRELLSRLDVASRQAAARMNDNPALANQMLMRYGAMEWVRCESVLSGWSAKGEPLPDFCGNLERLEDAAAPLIAEATSQRLPAAGFRLVWSPPPVTNSDGRPQTADPRAGG